MSKLFEIVSNVSGDARRTTFQGRDFIVAPLTMIVPGVLNGSEGPILYSKEEIGKNVNAWNEMPIVVNHPESGSARTPEVLDTTGIGFIFNVTTNADGALIGEGWFDVERTQVVDNRIYTSLVNEQKIELSTGLFLEKSPAEENATFNGVGYSFVSSAYRPDHLAILFDMKGACSVTDGCGVFNALSHDQVREKLTQVIRDSVNPKDDEYVYAAEVFDGSVVYERGVDLFKVDYTVKDDEVTLSGIPVLVERVTSYRPVSNSEKEGSMSKKTNEERSAIVNELVANCDCWNDEDKDVLNSFSDQKLDNLLAHNRKVIAANAEEEDEEDEEMEDNKKKPEKNSTSNNQQASPLTDEEWFNQAPESVREVFRNAQQVQNSQKEEIIQKLVTRVSDESTRTSVTNELRKESLEKLRLLESIVPEPPERRVANYSGSAAPSGNQQVSNFDESDILGLPWDDV